MQKHKGTDYFEYDLYQASIKGNLFERFFHKIRIREIEKKVKLSEKNVLDYGCGTGAILLPLAKKYKTSNFEGYDISQKNLEKCTNYSIKNDLKINLYNSHPNKKYDVVKIKKLFCTCDRMIVKYRINHI